MKYVLNYIRAFSNHWFQTKLINSQNAEVRKLIVLSIVDLHSLFSEGFDEYIQEFTAAQQKIIQIYLKRRLEKNK